MQVTGKDGAFNLKLESDCNYSLSVDKRSKGMLNRYKELLYIFQPLQLPNPAIMQ